MNADNTRPTLTPAQAEELRLAIKELGWVHAHLAKFYELSKPEGAPSAEPIDPNHLDLFAQQP